jgi:hypothetical protein
LVPLPAVPPVYQYPYPYYGNPYPYYSRWNRWGYWR